MTLTAGQALRLKIELAAPLLRRRASAFWETGDPKIRYLAYAQAMHTVIRASVPLMELAERRCAALPPADRTAAPLGAYLREHAAEERHHDEWLAEDLAAAGADPAQVLARRPAAAVASMVGAQYYWIAHYHPVCLLGYIGALEGTSPPPGMAEWLASRTGYPRAAFRTIHHHARADLAHAAGLYELIDGLGVNAAQAAAIGCSALNTIAGLGILLANLADATNRPEQFHVFS